MCRKRTVTPKQVEPINDAPIEEPIAIIDELATAPATPIKEPIPSTPSTPEHQTELENYKNMELESNVADMAHVDELDKIMDSPTPLTQRKIVRGILIVLALSMHSFFEGVAIGMQNSNRNIWYLFIAVSIHSATILFVIGLEMLLSHARIRTIVIHVIVLSVMSPLGVFTGLLITLSTDADTKAKTIGVTFLEGLSAGTILYITFFEVLIREKERRVYRLRRALAIIVGFGMMACLETAEVYY